MAERGRTGDTGRVGDTGRTGDEGAPGDSGAAGAAGKHGTAGPRGKPGTPIDAKLIWLLAGAAGLLLLIVGVMSTLTLIQQSKIDANSERIGKLASRTSAREVRDTEKLREAAWRGCQRDQLERADAYANQRQSLNSPSVRETFKDIDIDKLVERRKKNLPIFNCDPNMCDGSATILTSKEQDHFVDRYIAGKLAPNPEPPEVDCP